MRNYFSFALAILFVIGIMSFSSCGKDKDEKVTSVTLSPTTLKLTVDQEVRLSCNVRSGLTWESSNEVVATVSSNGTVRALSLGQAIITVTHNATSLSARCTVDVVGEVDRYEFSIANGAYDLTIGTSNPRAVREAGEIYNLNHPTLGRIVGRLHECGYYVYSEATGATRASMLLRTKHIYLYAEDNLSNATFMREVFNNNDTAHGFATLGDTILIQDNKTDPAIAQPGKFRPFADFKATLQSAIKPVGDSVEIDYDLVQEAYLHKLGRRIDVFPDSTFITILRWDEGDENTGPGYQPFQNSNAGIVKRGYINLVADKANNRYMASDYDFVVQYLQDSGNGLPGVELDDTYTITNTDYLLTEEIRYTKTKSSASSSPRRVNTQGGGKKPTVSKAVQSQIDYLESLPKARVLNYRF